MEGYQFNKAQTGSLIIAVFFLIAGSLDGITTLGIWASIFIASLAMMNAVLDPFFDISTSEDLTKKFSVNTLNDIPTWKAFGFFIVRFAAIFLVHSLIVAILCVSMVLSFGNRFDVTLKEPIRLVFTIWAFVGIMSCISWIPEAFGQIQTAERDLSKRSQLMQRYLKIEPNLRLVIALSVGAFLLTAAIVHSHLN